MSRSAPRPAPRRLRSPRPRSSRAASHAARRVWPRHHAGVPLPGTVVHAEPAPSAAYDVRLRAGWMEPAHPGWLQDGAETADLHEEQVVVGGTRAFEVGRGP